MIKLRFISASTGAALVDVDVESCDISWRLNEIEDWSAAIPTNLDGFDLVTEGDTIEITKDGVLFLTGIYQLKDQTLDDSNKYKVSGRGILDNLYAARAFSQAYYQDKELLLVVGELLRRVNWRIGQINTMADKTVKMTVDLRNEKRIFPQITKALGGISETYLRYGGNIVGKYAIDIGSFAESSDIEARTVPDGDGVVSFDNDDTYYGKYVGAIEKINVKKNIVEIINSVEAFGGEVKDNLGVTRDISLADALSANPALATDPNFPITTISTGVYLVRNNAVPTTTGSQSLERFTEYAPQKETGNATLAACQASGLALYNRCVAFLKDHQAADITYDVSVSGENLFLPVGDTIYVKAVYQNGVFDEFSEQVSLLTTDIEKTLRATNVKMSISGDVVKWSFTLVEGFGTKQEDLYVALYDVSKDAPQPNGAVVVPAFPPQLSTISLLVSNSAPDTTMSDGKLGKLVTLTQGAPPGGATNLYLAGIPYGTISGGELQVELVSDPVFSPVAGTVCRISLKTRSWQYGDSTTLTCHVIWI